MVLRCVRERRQWGLDPSEHYAQRTVRYHEWVAAKERCPMSTSNAGIEYPEETKHGLVEASCYIVKFDASGKLLSTETTDRLCKRLSDTKFDHICVICHGWNNTWPNAITLYDAFTKDYFEHINQAAPDASRLLWIGLSWPSAICMTAFEQGPLVAAARDNDEIDFLLDDLPSSVHNRLRELAAMSTLTDNAARELARLVAPATDEEPELPGVAVCTDVDRLLDDDVEPPDDPAGNAAPLLSKSTSDPHVAGISRYGFRDIVRAPTVWRMKDRAGRVGKVGAREFLQRLIAAANTTPVHLIGHSYGCKVMLSGVKHLSVPDGAEPPIDSMLLLQAAISARCFSSDATGNGAPGGYRSVLHRVRQPILATYSCQDIPLHAVYDQVLLRQYDLGDREPELAASIVPAFAALGGYGPQRTPEATGPMQLPEFPKKLRLPPGDYRVVGLNGDEVITGHGDVCRKETTAALLLQTHGV
jgi:hypothetical protein